MSIVMSQYIYIYIFFNEIIFFTFNEIILKKTHTHIYTIITLNIKYSWKYFTSKLGLQERNRQCEGFKLRCHISGDAKWETREDKKFPVIP